MSRSMGKPTTSSKFSICIVLHKFFFMLQTIIIWSTRVTCRLSIVIWRHKHKWSEFHVTMLHVYMSNIIPFFWYLHSENLLRNKQITSWGSTHASSTRYNLEFLPQICDVILANYDVSPSCRFPHAKAQILKQVLVVLCCLHSAEDWLGWGRFWGFYVNIWNQGRKTRAQSLDPLLCKQIA